MEIPPLNSIESRPAVIPIGAPLPVPGSVSIKYSAYSMLGLIQNLRPSYKLHLTSEVRVRIYKVCSPTVNPAVDNPSDILIESAVSETPIGVPLPMPGSVSKKYSSLLESIAECNFYYFVLK